MTSTTLAGGNSVHYSRHPLSRLLALACAIFICWYVLFRLPYAFPPKEKIVSTSYVLGFSNMAAMAGLVVLIAIGTVWRLWKTVPAPHLRFNDDRRDSIPVSIFIAVGVAYAVFTLAVYVWAARGVFFSMDWEASHFLWRMKLTGVYGLRPYHDYQFEYGPLLAYGAVLLHSVLGSVGISYEATYYLYHLILNVAGLGCLALVLNRMCMPDKWRTIAFAIVGLSGFLPNMGLSGVVLRYMLPLAGLALIHEAVLTAPARGNWRVFSRAFLACIVCVAVSSEVAVAFVIGLSTYSILSTRMRPVAGFALAAVLIAGIVGRIVVPAPYYASLLHFARGGNHLPFLTTSPHLLLYLGCLIWFVPQWLSRFRARDRDRFFVVALGVSCLAMSPGALGRCDPYHVLFYGLGLAALVFVHLANSRPPYFRAYGIAYALVFIVLLHGINFWIHEVTPRTILSRFTAPRQQQNFEPLAKYESISIPHGSYCLSKELQGWLWDRRKAAPEYYFGSMGVYSEEQIRQLLQDVSRFPVALVPACYDYVEASTVADACRSDWRYLRKAFLYPVRLWTPCRKEGIYPDREIAKYLERHYRIVEKMGEYNVLKATGE